MTKRQENIHPFYVPLSREIENTSQAFFSFTLIDLIKAANFLSMPVFSLEIFFVWVELKRRWITCKYVIDHTIFYNDFFILLRVERKVVSCLVLVGSL